ncbi:MAG: hypothetical protein ACRDHK_12685, partial [Actinomycetota bacterium]
RYSVPSDPSTAPATEIVVDVLNSPLIAKVNQEPDARGFSWTPEFRRLAMNAQLRIPTPDARLVIDVDSDWGDDGQNVLVAETDRYVEDRAQRSLASLVGPITESAANDPMDTFGPLSDPDGSLGENVGCDRVANSGDYGEGNGVLDTEDRGCDGVTNGGPGELNGILDTEDLPPFNGVLDGGEDVGCDHLVGLCPAGTAGETSAPPAGDIGCNGIDATCEGVNAGPGEPIGSGNIAEFEPNDCSGGILSCDDGGAVGGQVVTLPVRVTGTTSVGDVGGYTIGGDVMEDNFTFSTGVGITFTADISFSGAPATDIDFYLVSLPPLALAVVDAGATSANPEVMGPTVIPAGTYVIAVSAWDPNEDAGVTYTLRATFAAADCGCDGVCGNASFGEGNLAIDTPPDANGSEGNGLQDRPP